MLLEEVLDNYKEIESNHIKRGDRETYTFSKYYGKRSSHCTCRLH